MEKAKKLLKLVPIILITLVIIGLLVSNLVFFNKFQKADQLLKNPTEAAKIESDELLKKIGKMMDLPNAEEPTIATITDSEKLKEQPFFAKAKNGYKVIIYATAKKAILYDPTANKVIEVMPLTPGLEPSSIPGPIRIALYNGTETVGITQTFEKSITAKYPEAQIVLKDKSLKIDYQKSEVIDLTGKNSAMAENLAKEFNGVVITSLPEGEKYPEDADILMIIGKAKKE